MTVKTGMFVHGFNLNEPEWRRIVWGENGVMGRVPQAVYSYVRDYPQAEMILFGSGASERDGFKEGAYTIRYLMRHFEELSRFPQFFDADLASVRRRIATIAQPEIQSHNTFTELKFGIPHMYDAGCRRIVVVSELAHVSRCLAHAGQIVEEMGILREVELVAVASRIIPHKVKASGVVVFEPPMHGDNWKADAAKHLFGISDNKKSEFLRGFNALVESTKDCAA